MKEQKPQHVCNNCFSGQGACLGECAVHEENFSHFLSYTGFHTEPPEVIEKLKKAYLDGSEPKNLSLVLTSCQILALAQFAESEEQPSYTITNAVIPEFEAEDGTVLPEYSGLIAYSDSKEHGVLQLES